MLYAIDVWAPSQSRRHCLRVCLLGPRFDNRRKSRWLARNINSYLDLKIKKSKLDLDTLSSEFHKYERQGLV